MVATVAIVATESTERLAEVFLQVPLPLSPLQSDSLDRCRFRLYCERTDRCLDSTKRVTKYEKTRFLKLLTRICTEVQCILQKDSIALLCFR